MVEYEKLPEGVLRVEVHYGRDKLRTIERKIHSDNPLVILQKLMAESKERILKLVEKCYPDLAYYSIKDANTQVEQSTFHRKSKERMNELLELMKRRQSIDAAFKQMKNRGEKTEDLLDKFRKLGLNPIPLRVGYNVKYMPGLVEILRCVENKPVVVELQETKWK